MWEHVKISNPRIKAATRARSLFFSPLFCPRMVPLVRAHMLFLNRCSVLSKRLGGLACAVLIHNGRLLGLLPCSPLSGGSGSPRLQRRRTLPSSSRITVKNTKCGDYVECHNHKSRRRHQLPCETGSASKSSPYQHER